MADLQETPAVPPTDPGGDERLGFEVAGGLLVTFGWGIGVVANVLLHRLAPANGVVIGSIRLFPKLGPYSWAVLGFGLFAGALGVALLLLSRSAPKGPVVLPGYPY